MANRNPLIKYTKVRDSTLSYERFFVKRSGRVYNNPDSYAGSPRSGSVSHHNVSPCFLIFFETNAPVVPHIRIELLSCLFYEIGYLLTLPITVAARSEVRSVIVLSNTGVVGSNFTQDMDSSMCLFCVSALCVEALRRADPPSSEICRVYITPWSESAGELY
jgi:hypothetical protein